MKKLSLTRNTWINKMRKPLLFLVCLSLVLMNTPIVSMAQELATAEKNQAEVIEQEEVPNLTEEERQEKEMAEKFKNMSLEERFKLAVSLDLRNIDVMDALKFLATKGNLNIVATKNVSGRVTLNLKKVPIKDIFDFVLRSNALAYVKQGEVFNVMTDAEYRASYGRNFSDLREVKVFRLKYSIPEQAFNLLDALKSEVGRVLVDQEAGNVMLMDTPERMAMMQKALEEFERENIVEVFTLKYARAKEAEEILKTRLDAKNVGSVKADERNNQIIVQALGNRMDEVRILIASLDKPTKEVLIETRILRVKLTDQEDRGIQWEGIFHVGNKFGTTYFGSYPFSYMTAGTTTPTFKTRTDYYNSLGQNIAAYPFSGTTSSLSSSTKTTLGEQMHIGLMTHERDYDLLVNYLSTLGRTRLLANPKIAVVNNQEAKIHIGERQAYVTTTTSTGTATSTVSEEVQFVDVGIQLSVTPNINDEGYITMKIKPEVSSVASLLVTPTGNKIPIIDTASTETTVMMKDRTTLLIGGLRREEKIGSSEQFPFLGNIPFLGFLFKNSTDKTERIELLVMITPCIIRGDEFVTADGRDFGTRSGKEYEDYQAFVPDKTMVSLGESKIQLKPYREETMQENTPAFKE
jgi:type IV pilus assembly protein PilQ